MEAASGMVKPLSINREMASYLKSWKWRSFKPDIFISLFFTRPMYCFISDAYIRTFIWSGVDKRVDKKVDKNEHIDTVFV